MASAVELNGSTSYPNFRGNQRWTAAWFRASQGNPRNRPVGASST
jgi:hypothetical protein